jgi:hypothetical protein
METRRASAAPRRARGTHGRGDSSARLAWSLWAVTVNCTVGNAAFYVASRAGFFGEPLVVALLSEVSLALLASVALIITLRRPENAVGWAPGRGRPRLGRAAVRRELQSLRTHASRHPARRPAGGAGASVGVVALVALALVFLVFPTGHLPSRRWRPVAWALLAVGWLVFAALVLTPGPMLNGVPASQNPLGVTALRSVNLIDPLYLVLLGSVLLGLVSLLVRFRRARGDERQQLKWLPIGVALIVASFLIEDVGNATVNALADLLALAVLSGAILVAMLKYRLYDIDRILNRTLVYGLVTSLLIGVYAGLVFLLGRLLDPATGDSALAVAASTLAVAALFQPARRRVQAVVDRRFNRRKYNAAKTIEGFSARLRDQVDLDTLATELLAVTDKTMQPTTVSLWLRPPDEASKVHAPGWDY